MQKGDKVKVKFFTIGDENRAIQIGIVNVEAIHEFENVKYVQFVDEKGQFSMPLNRVNKFIKSGAWELICGCETCPDKNRN